ncbi:FAD-dependent oxidoreductase [Amycolatopsis sp. NPDC049253]|uniref:NAD(P)/FAD-dependent oxidoreductase n=1 Tax=Amycolatopsis sp. NPDC049253 TaxID=3155274 RepID=UPI0034376E34
MGRDADVIVVGAGCTGTAVAWQLAARGVEVLVLERERHASEDEGTAGFLAAEGDLAPHRCALQSLRLWRELESAAGVEVLTRTGGVVHGDTDELDLLAWAADAAGNPGRWLAPEEAVERWPGIRYGARVFFHPLGGRLDTAAAAAALRRRVIRDGGVVVREGDAVTAIDVRGERDPVVRTTARSYRARRVVLCAGVASRTLAEGSVPVRPLRPARAESIRCAPVSDDLGWPVFRHVLAFTERVLGGYPGPVLGTPVPGGGASVGFTLRGADETGRAARRRALTRYVSDRLPGLDPATAQPTGRRYAAGREPVLDRVGPLVVAAGFAGERFAFLPAIGRAVADLAMTSDPRSRGLAS